jgi:hypothetical protein
MEIPYGKYVDSNINHDLPLSTEIIPYKAIKIDISNEMEANHSIDHIAIHVIDTSIQHAIIQTMNQRERDNRLEYIKCNCDLIIIKWIVISSFTISILFVFISSFFSN